MHFILYLNAGARNTERQMTLPSPKRVSQKRTRYEPVTKTGVFCMLQNQKNSPNQWTNRTSENESRSFFWTQNRQTVNSSATGDEATSFSDSNRSNKKLRFSKTKKMTHLQDFLVQYISFAAMSQKWRLADLTSKLALNFKMHKRPILNNISYFQDHHIFCRDFIGSIGSGSFGWVVGGTEAPIFVPAPHFHGDKGISSLPWKLMSRMSQIPSSLSSTHFTVI